MPVDTALTSTAHTIAGNLDESGVDGSIVIAVHRAPELYVVAGGDNGVLRAAVAVAIAGGHQRLFDGVPNGTTAERAVRSLPEVVRAAAEGNGLTTLHLGAVDDDVLVIWHDTSNGTSTLAERERTLALLRSAAERDRAGATPDPDTADDGDRAGDTLVDITVDIMVDITPGRRTFDPDDPRLDPVTGVAVADRLDEALLAIDTDEVALVVISVDFADRLRADHGDEAFDLMMLEVADRLVSTCRAKDLIARIADDSFAVLFHESTRSDALHASKRLVMDIARPLPAGLGPDAVTATVGLAHQAGLVDAEELLDSARAAVVSSRRSGPGRLVLAA